MSDKDKNQSGWYQTDDGQSFHVHGQDMPDETIAAISKLADHIGRMLDMVCPQCGAQWRKGLDYKDKRWFCECGWEKSDE